jgi:thymidylate synthase
MLLNRYKQLSPALKKQFRARNPGESDLDDIAALLDELENPPNIRDLAARTSAVGGDAA